MKNGIGCSLTLVLLILTGCAMRAKTVMVPDTMQPSQVKFIMTKVADWQIAHPSRQNTRHWTHGALFAGLSELALMADNDKYTNALLEFGEKNNWQPNNEGSPYHADNHTVGQMYLEMYSRFKDPKMLAGIKDRFDFILTNRSNVELHVGKQGGKDRWWWCDALFMAPPVWAKLSALTGERKYLEFMNEEWWYTTDYLYDKEEHLYFRDENYFNRREANGKKIFWSRGDGWVLAGLARVLESMPEDFKDRPRYIKIYKEMAAKIAKIQQPDGLWHSSLLDPASYPMKESSGSGFYCYALAWGINRGILNEKTYLPAVIKAWEGLVGCVNSEGRLGFVQPIGEDPRKVNEGQTDIYGVGAFLLAGSEVYKIAVRYSDNEYARKGVPFALINITNPVAVIRDSETINLNWKQIEKNLPFKVRLDLVVFDFKTNKILYSERAYDAEDKKFNTRFQADLAPGERRTFWLMKRPQGMQMPSSRRMTACSFIPERKDDFGWENDKAAYRMYGPALEIETITCGIDAWGKSTPYPVIHKFIASGDYHTNHGEGGDFYSVGNTLGCGGAAPLLNDKVILPRNFKQWKIFENVRMRSTFELYYAPWKVGSRIVSETKRISIDLGSNMNKIECTWSGDDKVPLPAASGIILRNTSSEKFTDTKNVIGYWLPADGNNNGMMGCGVVFGKDVQAELKEADNHLLLVVNQPLNKPLIYYAGSCWNSNKEFATFEQWKNYLINFKQRIDNPVVVKFED